MNTILTIILTVSLTVALTSLSKKYFEPTLPDKKNAISYIKKFFLISFKYVLPIFVIIFSYITLDFNKFYVIINCSMFSVLFTNATLDSTRMNRMLIYDRFNKRFDELNK